jgi:hypothetical protein
MWRQRLPMCSPVRPITPSPLGDLSSQARGAPGVILVPVDGPGQRRRAADSDERDQLAAVPDLSRAKTSSHGL